MSVHERGSLVLTRDMKILNRLGIHARPAALFVKTASRFDAEITVEKDGNRVSGKSIMGLMTIEACQGSVLNVTAEGTDAEEALNALQKLVLVKFDEE